MQWVAYYSDGSSLPQYNADGSENKYQDIDRSRLESFALWQDSTKVFHLHIEPGQRLIYRRRVEMPQGTSVYLVGWQQTVGTENIQSIAYVFPNGSVELAGRWREGHPWFYSIKAVAGE